MKKTTYLIMVILVIFTLVFSIASPTQTYASEPQGTQGDGGNSGGTSGTSKSGKINPDNFEPPTLNTSDYGGAFKLGNRIISAVRAVGIVVSVAGLMILGIMYMVGSVEQRAEYKKTMVPYLIGCVLIFSITAILSTIATIVSDVKV